MISKFKGLIGGAVLALGTVVATAAIPTQKAEAASVDIRVPGLGIHIGRGHNHYNQHYRPHYRPYYAPHYSYRPYYAPPRYCGPRTVWNGYRYVTRYGC